ncbi:DivIVA domain-containing protein [Aestuariimicrobium soli]|uniref:DivIVA domain-containing protein n=1 Tax=Aestuariimicrobium soli TaxID=2035834 RepID=UPI003EC135B6
MTMTLDEVNQIRFPMARRPNEGYRAQEVDEFVDRVVATFQSLQDEAERAKAQAEAVRSDQGGAGQPGSDKDRAEQERAAQALSEENARLKAELADLRSRGDQGGEAGQPDTSELDALRQRNAELEQRGADLERQLTEAREQAAAQPVASSDQGGDDRPAEGMVEHGTGKLERVVVTTSADASPAVIRLVQLATEQAEGVVADAERDAEGVRAAAEADAKKTRADADSYAAETSKNADEYAASTIKAADEKAAQINAEAKAGADSLLAQARSNADQVEVDAKNRRSELFQALEAERDTFASKVDQLKAWESEYRTSLTQHLRSQADQLDSGEFQPGSAAALLGEERHASATPRLDALLANKQ